MRIAVLSAFLFDRSVGGIENHVRFMVKHLQRRGHEILVFRPLFGASEEDSENVVDDVRIRTIQLADRRLGIGRLGGGSLVGLAAAFLNKLAYSRARTRV